MKLNPKLKRGINAVIICFAAWAIVGILINSKQIESVSVGLLPGGIEHKDKTLLGVVGKNDEPADYNLRVRSKDGWVDLGTFVNTPIGSGLEFTPNESYPTRLIQEIQLLDQDKLENDILDQGPLKKGSYQGSNYAFEVRSEFSLQAGFHWFFATPVGIAILAGVGLGVFVIVANNFDF